MFVYEKEDKIVGICQLILLPKPYQDTLIIGTVAIDPHHQRKGHATGMFKDIFKWIKENHPEIVRAELYAETDNPNARKLYEKIGFRTEVILNDWFKRHTGSHQHKWYMSEHIMTLMLKDISSHAPTKTSKLISTKYSIHEPIFRKVKAADLNAINHLLKQQYDYLELDAAKLKRRIGYVLEQKNKIIAFIFMKKGSERLNHNVFIETCVIDCNYDDKTFNYFLKQFIQAQVKSEIKRLEINLTKLEQRLIKNLLDVGFESKGTLKARFKHPQTQEYFDQEVLEYSLFNLNDAIACIEANETKDLNNQKLIDYLNQITTTKMPLESEHLIYKLVREIYRD